MSVIAPKFRLGYFLKGIFDNAFWILTIVTLAGIPAIQIVLFYMDISYCIIAEQITPICGGTFSRKGQYLPG